jgi:hypothetical protein
LVSRCEEVRNPCLQFCPKLLRNCDLSYFISHKSVFSFHWNLESSTQFSSHHYDLRKFLTENHEKNHHILMRFDPIVSFCSSDILLSLWLPLAWILRTAEDGALAWRRSEADRGTLDPAPPVGEPRFNELLVLGPLLCALAATCSSRSKDSSCRTANCNPKDKLSLQGTTLQID